MAFLVILLFCCLFCPVLCFSFVSSRLQLVWFKKEKGRKIMTNCLKSARSNTIKRITIFLKPPTFRISWSQSRITFIYSVMVHYPFSFEFVILWTFCGSQDLLSHIYYLPQINSSQCTKLINTNNYSKRFAYYLFRKSLEYKGLSLDDAHHLHP